jgi:hypothetical protein
MANHMISNNRRQFIIAGSLVLAVVVIGALLLLFVALPILNGNDEQIPALAALPTTTTLPTSTGETQQQESPPALPTETEYMRPTLPPTWTPIPTAAATSTSQIAPTNKAAAQATATPAMQPTLDPALLTNTYWEGDGTFSMRDAQFPDGGFGRFSIFPVNIWIDATGSLTLTAEHEQAIQNALNEIGRIVPIQRVQSRIFAHMTVWLMDDPTFNQNVSCDTPDMTVGCTSTSFTDAGIMLNTIWLRVTDTNFAATLLHELTHGLGVLVHSPDPQDIMYAFEAGQPPQFTERDINTIRALYSAPAYVRGP